MVRAELRVHRPSTSAGAAIAAFLLSVFLVLGAGASTASAAPEATPTWALRATFDGGPAYESPQNPIAIDSHQNILVTNQDGSALVFAPDPVSGGTFLTSFGIPGFSLGPRNIAVDPSNDAIYVDESFAFGEETNHSILRLTSDGAEPPTYTIDSGFEVPRAAGFAVDPTTQNLLVADPGAEGVHRYSSAGAELGTIATPALQPAYIAILPDGSFYAAAAGGPDAVHFAADGTVLGTIAGVGSPQGLTWDAAGNQLIVAVEGSFKTYTAAGQLVSTAPAQGGGGGLAFDSAFNLLYAAEGGTRVYETATLPGVEAPQVSAIDVDSAEVSAEVDPGAGPPENSLAHFEVSTDGGLSWPEELKTPDVPVERTVIEGPDTIEAELTGLISNSDYLVRVVASNALTTTHSDSTAFHTALGPPEVETGPAVSITDTKAELTGTIDTIGGQTTYHFEYGTTTAYGSRVPVVGQAPAGMSRTPRTVSRPIGGLQPDTTYHFRLVATNSAGTTEGPDRTFSTAAAAPPLRHYEQVTPVDKKGGILRPNVGFQAADDGSAVSYLTVAAPADAPSAVLFNRYLSRRGSDDWLNWSSTDPPVSVARNSIEVVTQAISADFSHALVVSNRALAPGAQDGSGNIYVVDLLTDEYTLVGSAPGWRAYEAMAGFQSEYMFLAGAPDFSWITILSPKSLRPDAPPVAMYRWSREDGLTLQSPSSSSIRLPDTQGEYSSRWVSDDGNVMFYEVDGPGPARPDGPVYRHVLGGDAKPVSVAEEGGDVPAGTVVEATLDGASRDGRYVFFRTRSRLTADNPPSLHHAWMYRFDAETEDLEFVGQPVNENPAGIVYGVGDDGKTVFFGDDTGGAVSWRDGITHKFTDEPLHISQGFGLQHFASPNGRYLAYVGSQDPTVHLYDAQTQTDVCLSCPPDGGDGGRDFGLPGGTRTVSNRTPLVVSNSGLMFFDTAARLIAADHNGSRDVYSYQDGQLSLISPGDGNFSAQFGDATPDGSVVYFTTDQSLVGQDTDNMVDVYASRVGPAFDQSAISIAPCADEACQGPNPSPPAASNLGSNASGNPGDSAGAAISGIRRLSSSDLSTLAKGGKVRLKLTVTGPGKVSVTGKAKVGKKSRQVVSASAKAGKAGLVGVPFGLSKAGLSQLKSKGSLTVTLTVRFKDATPKAVKFTLRAATSKKGGRS